jgi:anti-anti-sigma regulatory factor
MCPFVISIPRWVEENHFPHLLALLATGEGHPAIEVDIAAVKFLTPAAIVAILARCNRWKREGRDLSLVGVESCENLGYLQRIDFLTHLGVEIPENFTRRAASGRFVPVQTLNFASGEVDRIASEITRCTLPDANPEDDVYRILQYAAGELLSNAKYHSGGRAYVCAQFFPTRNQVRIAVADDGMGIRGSFVNTSREDEANTPDAAIRLALQPRVSSALLRPNPNPYAGQNHRGVGLSITRILAKEAGGQLTIASEDGWFDELHSTEQARPRPAIFFPGTLVAVSLHRDQIADYAAMHAEAMSQIGMGSIDTPGMFME